MPISLEQPLHKGESLRALLAYYKKYNPVLLLADTLHRFNHDEITARAKGEQFIAEHAEIISGYQLQRWDEWTKKYHAEIEGHKQALNSLCVPGSLFYEKCVLTAETCQTISSLENSLAYQIEEYAAIFVMSREFDYLVYPRAASPGNSIIYKLFPDIRKPVYVNANAKRIPLEQYQERNDKPLPVAIRLLLDHIESILASSEISSENKRSLITRIEDLADVYSIK
jgi:hypothetical protein